MGDRQTVRCNHTALSHSWTSDECPLCGGDGIRDVDAVARYERSHIGTVSEAELIDHSEHGRGDAETGPRDSDCPCRTTMNEDACAAAGCGFCSVASTHADDALDAVNRWYAQMRHWQRQYERVREQMQRWKAEAEMLRGIGCGENGDGPCGVCRKCAEQDAERLASALRLVASTLWLRNTAHKIRPIVTDALVAHDARPIPTCHGSRAGSCPECSHQKALPVVQAQCRCGHSQNLHDLGSCKGPGRIAGLCSCRQYEAEKTEP